MDKKKGSLKNRTLLVTLLLPAILLSGCNSEPKASCQKTAIQFVEYFNGQDFTGVVNLFKRNQLKRPQINELSNNLEYIYGAAGEIKRMEFKQQSNNQINYVSIHENTFMDVVFKVNDQCQLVSFLINTHYPDSLPQLERNTTSMNLPFRGEWYVEWGGPELEQNYHNGYRNMRGAIDFTIRDENGKSYNGDGESNEDYYAYGQEVIAPCAATVVAVNDGVEDNPVGKSSARDTYGNSIVLQTELNEFLLLAHLQSQSIKVKQGQKVNRGDLLARCGNSGYSNKPHLHFIVQNVANLFHPTGASSYFNNIEVNGVLKQDYSPVQGELVRNHSFNP